MARHDGALPRSRLNLPTVGACYHPAVTEEDPRTVNPVLAAGQLIVSVALTFAILLQSRGSGLGGTFGGDSAVYRSRRGIERRLWQFTIVLIALFVMFSLAGFILSPSA
jgi:preprotein translocase subunit SecG